MFKVTEMATHRERALLDGVQNHVLKYFRRSHKTFSPLSSLLMALCINDICESNNMETILVSGQLLKNKEVVSDVHFWLRYKNMLMDPGCYLLAENDKSTQLQSTKMKQYKHRELALINETNLKRMYRILAKDTPKEDLKEYKACGKICLRMYNLFGL